MSDPKREDLAIRSWDERHGVYAFCEVTDAEFDAIVDADPNWTPTVMYDELQGAVNHLTVRLAEWERFGVKVWEDCPNQCDQGVVLTDVCGCGRINHAEHFEERECADCGGSGKVPAEGVPIVEASIAGIRPVTAPISFGRHALIPLEASDDECRATMSDDE